MPRATSLHYTGTSHTMWHHCIVSCSKHIHAVSVTYTDPDVQLKQIKTLWKWRRNCAPLLLVWQYDLRSHLHWCELLAVNSSSSSVTCCLDRHCHAGAEVSRCRSVHTPSPLLSSSLSQRATMCRRYCRRWRYCQWKLLRYQMCVVLVQQFSIITSF